jgi:hypothetical protein
MGFRQQLVYYYRYSFLSLH